MNKRQAKKGNAPHGSWRKVKDFSSKDPYPSIPRIRQRVKWNSVPEFKNFNRYAKRVLITEKELRTGLFKKYYIL